MTSLVVKRSVVIAGHKTSVSLGDAFWSGPKEIAKARRLLLSELLAEIDGSRPGNLSSAIRTYVFDDVHARVSASPGDRFGPGMPNAVRDGTQSSSGAPPT